MNIHLLSDRPSAYPSCGVTTPILRSACLAIRVCVGLLLGVAIVGCTGTPVASIAVQNQAQSFIPPAGKAAIYVGRRSFYGTAVVCTVFVFPGEAREQYTTDEVARAGYAQVFSGSYAYIVVDPGVYTLKWNPQAASRYSATQTTETFSQSVSGGQTIALNAEAGRNYYFKPNWDSLARLVPIDEKDGPKSMDGYTVSGRSRNPDSSRWPQPPIRNPFPAK